MKPVLAKLRQKGHESVQYIDDGFLKGFTYKECQQNLMDTVQLLQDMGFIIHPEKSVLTPVQEITFLGFVPTMTVSLTEEKKAKIKSSCSRLIACTRPKIRHVAEVIGLLVSALKASGLIIVPNWPTQAWYPTLYKLLIQPPFLLSRHRELLFSPVDSSQKHPLHRKMDLLACLISGEQSHFQ